MGTLNFIKLTLGISVWYLDPPPTPLPPSCPTPYLALTHMQLISMTHVSPKAPMQGPTQPK